MGKAIVFFVLTVVLVWGGYYWTYQRELPEPVELSLPFLSEIKAEIRSGETVKPGTFKIEISLGELSEKARSSDKRTIVVYEKNYDLSRYVVINYWLPRQQDGIFYHHEETFFTGWPVLVKIKQLKIQGDNIIATPEPNNELITVSFFVPALMFGIGGARALSRHRRGY